jgi:predicted MPP superfamily phosphohydrolase
MNRRSFFRNAAVAGAAVALPIAVTGVGFAESTHLRIDRQTLAIPRLPAALRGKTVAFVTDIHRGPFVSESDVANVVRTTMALAPDLIVLGGDYSHRETQFIAPCFDLLADLDAPLGVYGVLGNHDYKHGLAETKAGMRAAKVAELTNRGVALTFGGETLHLCGVDDLWHGRPDVDAALAGVRPQDGCLLVSHNPDVAQEMPDRRVGLMLSGHTHGGQVVVPGYGAPLVPSRYGRKYAHGLCQAPETQIYVSAGTGMSVLPVRLGCRPEITRITLA